MYIGGRPSLEVRRMLLGKGDASLPFPLSKRECEYHYSARYALAAAINRLGLLAGEKILVPSYNCGIEIEPMLALGLEPVFYRIGRDLMPDVDDLRSRIVEGVKAVMVTHFLGYPQPLNGIEETCREKGVFLIEDCAHAFLSCDETGTPLGNRGDAAFFSLVKALPIPDGGVQIVRGRRTDRSVGKEEPNGLSTIMALGELMRTRTRDSGNPFYDMLAGLMCNFTHGSTFVLRVVSAVLRRIHRWDRLFIIRPDSYDYLDHVQKWKASPLAMRMSKRMDFEGIKAVRRNNFQTYLDHFKSGKRWILPLEDLPGGVNPLFFPIIVESEAEREELYRRLRDKGVTTHLWWARFHRAVPWKAFPDSVYLKERVLGLPVHQSLRLNSICRVIEEIEKACE
jgi:dTDP-4-amino-4,6-dideoxygalactose transaminase